MKTKTFCPIPYMGGCVRPDGYLSVCCVSKDYKDSDIEQFFYTDFDKWTNSEQIQNFRKDLANGIEHKWCERCWVNEKNKNKSMRQGYISGLYPWDVKEALNQYKQKETVFNSQIKFLDFKLGNLCNLMCVMCNPHSSSRILTERIKNPDIFLDADKFKNIDYTWPETTDFLKFIEQYGHSLSYVKFTGGEPLINPYILNVLDRLNKKCIVNISTNGTVSDSAILTKLQEFENVWITISVDAVDKLYNYIRYPSNYDNIHKNIIKYQKQIPHGVFDIAVTIGFVSLLDIDNTINKLSQFVNDFTLIKVNSPKFLSVNAIPEFYAEVIAEKIKNINNQNVAKRIDNILSNRKFDNDLYLDFLKYINNLNKVRKLNFNHLNYLSPYAMQDQS